MAKKTVQENQEPKRLVVSPTTRVLWENIAPEDYALINLEHNRLSLPTWKR